MRERVKRLERELEQGSDSGNDRELTAAELEDENQELREQLERLERRLERSSRSDKTGND